MMIKIKRLFATLIDYIFSFFVVYVPLSIFNKIFLNNLVIIMILTIIFLILFVLLIINKDITFNGASIGKKIFGLAVYNKRDEKLTNKILLKKRNIKSFLVFPIYIFMILINNKSFGDYVCNTKVSPCKK